MENRKLPTKKMVTEAHIQKAKELYELCKNGSAPTIEVKTQMINLYNDMYGTTYRNTTNCSSCLNVVFNAIKKHALRSSIKKK